MNRLRAAWLGLAVAIAGAALAYALPARRHPPFLPQFRRQVRDQLESAVVFATRLDPRGDRLRVSPPPMPSPAANPSLAAYRSALAAGSGHPGATSLRADADLYCEYNQSTVERQARKEGLTTAEVRELTFVGMAVMRTTQAAKVQQALGRELSAEERERLAAVLPEQNESFKEAMRQKVDEGASTEERWSAIRDFEERYVQFFRQTFGMTEAQFDLMLAPDSAARPGPAVPVPLPAGVPLPPPPAPHPPVTEPPPGAPDRKPAPAGEMTPVTPRGGGEGARDSPPGGR